MLRSITKTLILVFLSCSYAAAKTVTIDGTFYPPKIDRYCLKPTADTDIKFEIDSRRKNCLTVYDYTSKLGEDCDYSSYLHIYNLKKDTTYYTVEARLKSSTRQTDYSITVKGDNFEFGLCPTETLAKSTNIDPKNLSFMLSLAGLFSGIIFFGSITYITLTIKEW